MTGYILFFGVKKATKTLRLDGDAIRKKTKKKSGNRKERRDIRKNDKDIEEDIKTNSEVMALLKKNRKRLNENMTESSKAVLTKRQPKDEYHG